MFRANNIVYAENTPESLTNSEIVRACVRRAATQWFPFALRVLLAMVLWLFVVPLLTSWLYRIWIHRTRVIAERLTLDCVWSDCVAGLIVVAAVIISFLSLMSFADFLRFHWDVPEQDDRHPLRAIRGRAPAVALAAADVAPAAAARPPAVTAAIAAAVAVAAAPRAAPANPPVQGAAAPPVEDPTEEIKEELSDDSWSSASSSDDDDDGGDDGGDGLDEVMLEEVPGLEEDQLDVELHVAVDELLGIQGPVQVLLRNLLWLLAFNCAYLGLFAFIPFSIGSSVLGAMKRHVSTAAAPLVPGLAAVRRRGAGGHPPRGRQRGPHPPARGPRHHGSRLLGHLPHDLPLAIRHPVLTAQDSGGLNPSFMGGGMSLSREDAVVRLCVHISVCTCVHSYLYMHIQ